MTYKVIAQLIRTLQDKRVNPANNPEYNASLDRTVKELQNLIKYF